NGRSHVRVDGSIAQIVEISCAREPLLAYSAKHSLRGDAPIVGPIIENPLHGERIRFLKTAPETNGELVQYESWLAPGGGVGVPHIHPVQQSDFTVVSGTASFFVHGAGFVHGSGLMLAFSPGRVRSVLY